MAVDLTGPRSIIEAYLKGVALRQQKEQNLNQLEIQRGAQELRQQQLDQQLKIADQRFQDYRTRTELQAKAADATNKLREFQAKTQFAHLIKNDIVRPVDPNIEIDPLNEETYRYTTPEERQQTITKGKVSEAKDMLPVEVEKAGAIEQAKTGPRAVLAGITSDLQLRNADAQRKFQEEENRKNREAARANALTRANATMIRLDAKKEEKDADIQNAIDNSYPEALDGSLTMEDLGRNTNKEINLKVQNAIKSEGIRILRNQERDDLNALTLIRRFYEKAEKVNEIVNKKGQFATIDPEYQTFQRELQQDLDAVGRAVKGFKGMITEADTKRLIGGIPQALPGGVLSWIQRGKDIRIANQRRLDSIKDMIFDKFNLITKVMNPQQKEAIRKRYDILEQTVPNYLERVR